MIFILEIIGTVAFAISGAMVGIRRQMDVFGVTILGMTTAVGGGIIRDLIIGLTPPMAFQKPVYALIAIAVSIIVFLRPVRESLNLDTMGFNMVDAVGLGIFTVIGVRAGAEYHNLFLEVFLGTLTGVGGGVLRDLFAAEKPFIFVKHFYACACIIGAVLCGILIHTNETIAIIAGTACVIILRAFAAKYHWNLPRA